MKKTIFILALALVFVLSFGLAACKQSKVESVTISPKTAEVEVGKSVQLTATVTPSDANDAQVVWSVESSEIGNDYTLGEDGKFTAGSTVGKVVVKAAVGDKSDTATVIVKAAAVDGNEVASVAFNGEKALESAFGAETVLSVTVLPETATNKTITYSVIETNLGSDYTLEGNKFTAGQTAGYAVIQASSANGKTDKVSIVINHQFSEPTDNKIKVTFYAPDGKTVVDIRYADKDGKVTAPDYQVLNSSVQWLDSDKQVVNFDTFRAAANCSFTAKVDAEVVYYTISYWYNNGTELVQQGQTFTFNASSEDKVTPEQLAAIEQAVEEATSKEVINWKMDISSDGLTIKCIAEFAE